MQFRSLFTGEQLPVLGFGTWRLGGVRQPEYGNDREAIQALRTAIDLGFTHIDTAEMYASGHTEELVGQAIQPYERSSILVSTKIWHTHLGYEDVFRALDGSLRRLQTDYVDFYSIHLPSPDVPLDETFAALNQLVRSGKVRHLGVSNFSVQQMQQARALAETPIVVSQAPLSLYNRKHIRSGMLRACQDNGIHLGAYSPFERGDVLENPLVLSLAEKYNATPAQICLAWLVQHPGMIVYLMSLKREHLQENLDALQISLSPEDAAALDEIDLPEEKLWPV